MHLYENILQNHHNHHNHHHHYYDQISSLSLIASFNTCLQCTRSLINEKKNVFIITIWKCYAILSPNQGYSVTIVYMYCVLILNTLSLFIQDTGYMYNAPKGLCLPIYRASAACSVSQNIQFHFILTGKSPDKSMLIACVIIDIKVNKKPNSVQEETSETQLSFYANK